MKHKIIPVESDCCANVALNIVRDNEDDDGKDVVVISAWHFNDDGNNHLYQCEMVEFSTFALCERFIADFSPQSAQDFAASFVL